MRVESPLVNKFWSMTKQESVAKTVQQLLHRGVQRIDLVIAAYDRRLLPDVYVHQYEKSTAAGYPWALKMLTHGSARATVERADHETTAA